MSKAEIFSKAWKGNHPDLRLIEKDEIIIEHDNCDREEGLRLVELTLNKIGDNYQVEYWDHEGKSPHLHIKNIQGLKDLTSKQLLNYKQAFITKYAGNPDKADYSLAGTKHLIAKENRPHWKIEAENKDYDIKRLIKIINQNMINNKEELVIYNKKFQSIDERNIIDLAITHGLNINSSNKALCVFHKETKPSLQFYPGTNTAYCFGCNKWFDYDKLKSELENNVEVDITLLENPDLFNILIKEINKKVVGDEDSIKFDLIALCSIFVNNLEQNPNLMLSSQSSSGKSYITKSVCKLFSLTGRIEMYSKITSQALAYLHSEDKEFTWNNKLLYIEDAQRTLMNSETFKVFISEGLEKTASVLNNKSQVIRIKGKPTIFTTTANVDLIDEMSNRFIVINVDESFGQIKKVLEYQAKNHQKDKVLGYDKKIMASLKGLKNVNVVIPYASLISEQFCIDLQRVKRDFSRFLSLLQAYTALHQYQREKDEGNIISTIEDYEVVRKLYQKKVLDHENFFGLSHREQKALNICREHLKEQGAFNASEICSNHPIVSLQTWTKWLPKFVNLKLLTSNYVVDGSKHYTEYGLGVDNHIHLEQVNQFNQDLTS